jgi:hypothetical protein
MPVSVERRHLHNTSMRGHLEIQTCIDSHNASFEVDKTIAQTVNV